MRSDKRIYTENREVRRCRQRLVQALAIAVLLPAACAADDFGIEAGVQQPSQSSVRSDITVANAAIAAAIQPQTVHEAEAYSITGQSAETVTPESGFWFLNTHQSPQTFSTSGPVFRPQVCRYEKGIGYRPSDYSEMLSRLEPGVPVCIMAHGSFVDTLSATRESAYTYHWIRSAAGNQRMQMIYFHWPSYRALSPLIQLDTNQLGRQAARNGFYLAELISALPPECPVSILGHSHGSRVASSALHLLAGGNVQGYRHRNVGTNGRPIRTVFLAGAIDHHWLNPGEKYDRALSSTQGILNLKNRVDPALAIYPFRLPLLTRRPIGSLGMTNGDRRRTGPQSQKVVDFEVSEEIGHSHLWPYYFNSQRIANTMRNYVYFPDLVSPNRTTGNRTATQATVSTHTALNHTVSRQTTSQRVSNNYISQADSLTMKR